MSKIRQMLSFCHKIDVFWENYKRSIFQTFWKQDSFPDFLFIKLEMVWFSDS